MFYADPRLAKVLMAIRLELGTAGSRTLRHQVKAERQGRSSQQSHRLIRGLGTWLVDLGRRLQQHRLPQTLPLEGKIAGGR